MHHFERSQSRVKTSTRVIIVALNATQQRKITGAEFN